MLIWLLISLVTMLIMIHYDREETETGPEAYSGTDWLWLFFFSFVFPAYYIAQSTMALKAVCKKISWKPVHTFLMQPINFGEKK